MPAPRVRSIRSTALIAAMVALASTAIFVRPVAAQDELVLEKYVAAVNAAAPADLAAIVVAPGDSITYGLSVSSSPSLAGSEVTLTDVVATNRLEFQGAEPAGCTEEAGSITCLVTLDDAGATEVLLSFTVLPAEGSSDGCQQVVNNARVEGDGGVQATAQSRVDVCPTGAVPAAESGDVAAGTPAAAESGDVAAGTPAAAAENPNTAVERPDHAAFLVQIGAAMIATAMFVALHAGHRLVPVSRRLPD